MAERLGQNARKFCFHASKIGRTSEKITIKPLGAGQSLLAKPKQNEENMINRDLEPHRQMIQSSYNAVSFSPERRAEQDIKEYAEIMARALDAFKEKESEELFNAWEEIAFNKKMRIWQTQRRCLSSMITGPANFPVARAQKAGNAHRQAEEDFINFLDNVEGYIYGKKPELKVKHENQHKEDSIIEDIKQELAGGRVMSAGTQYAYTYRMSRPLLAGRIRTLMRRGQTETLKRVFELLATGSIFAKNNSIFAEYQDYLTKSEQPKAPSESVINGVRVFENSELDRIQLFFDGKPEAAMIAILKKNAFKWSPRNQCWQRQLTDNARRATVDVLKKMED